MQLIIFFFLCAQIKELYRSTKWLTRQLIVHVVCWVDPRLRVNAWDNLSNHTNVFALSSLLYGVDVLFPPFHLGEEAVVEERKNSFLHSKRVMTIDGQMGWAKRAARGTTRFGPAHARPGPHKDGPGRHGPLWRAMLGPLPRHVGRHGTARLSGWHDLARYIFPYTLKFVTFVIVWTYYT
jgi:hypothetical protein